MTGFTSTSGPGIELYATALHWWRPAVAVAFFFAVYMALEALVVACNPRWPRLSSVVCRAVYRCPARTWACVRCKKRLTPEDWGYDSDVDAVHDKFD